MSLTTLIATPSALKSQSTDGAPEQQVSPELPLEIPQDDAAIDAEEDIEEPTEDVETVENGEH